MSKQLKRLRWSGGLPVPTSGEVPYAKCREELKDFTEAQATRQVLDSSAWQEVMVPLLDEVDRQRLAKGKERPLYSSHLLESVLLYQRVCGLQSYRAARDRLASDKGPEARRLLGLDSLRRYRAKPGKRVVRLMEGIPSESSVSRHRHRFPESERAAAYEELFRRLVADHLVEWEEMREEARRLNLDGTSLLTHYTCAKIDKATGEVVNARKITCFDGGYMGHDAPTSKQGHGWNLVSATTSTGLPLAYRLTRIHDGEPTAGIDVLDDYKANVLPSLGAPAERRLTVLSADGAFNCQGIRYQARALGILENIHVTSHSKKPESLAKAEERDKEVILFDDPSYKNWHANGHREVFCECGKQATKRIAVNKGRVVSRVEGHCEKCGTVTITSGQWRYVSKPKPGHFVRCASSDSPEDRDWQLGNPLTFNSREGHEYGQRRFWHNEGFHGALVTRSGLAKGKRWFRRRDQARIDVAMVFCIQHVIAMEQRRRVRAGRSQGPPLRAVA